MGRKHLLVGTITVLALVVAAASASADGEALLRCRFKPGQKYRLATTFAQDIKQHFEGRENPMKQTVHVEIDMNVLSVDAEGMADIKVTYRRFALKQSSPAGGTIDYDSADPEKADVDPPALAGLKALVGKSLTVTMDERAQVKGVKGLKELREALLDAVPPGPGREAARRQTERMVSEEAIVKQMASVGANCPEKPVGVGDTWKQVQETDVGFAKLKITSTYTVASLTDETVHVNLKSVVTSADAEGGLPMTIRVDKGNQTGRVKIARANAVLTDGTIHQDMHLTVTFQGRVIEMDLKGTADMKVTIE